MKQIYYTFRQHGIVVPMPIRALQIGSRPERGIPEHENSVEASISAAEVASILQEMRRKK
jgi:hypothetical protein